jgi:ComF family protein
MRYMRQILDWVYPRVCPGCQTPSDREERQWCWSCLGTISLFEEHGSCSLCGHPSEGRVGHAFVCGACRAHKPAFDRARSAADFRGTLQDQIHAFKYHQALWMKQDLCDLLQGAVEAHFKAAAIDVVLPVPLFSTRQRERSYNQAALLAEELALRLDRRYDEHALVRLRKTETQTHFNAVKRRENMRGAFAVARPEWVRQRCVLLVDDVMTTGATLHECAKALKGAGARTVWALTVARKRQNRV